MNLSSRFFSVFGHDWAAGKKNVSLAASLFLVVAAYTVVQGLKDSIFVSIVGREYKPWATFTSIFFLMPAIMLHSRLLDWVRRDRLFIFYTMVFGILSFILAYFLGHPTIGMSNTNTSAYRLFGWIFYFFVESYFPFIVSMMWALLNSVNTLDSARASYGPITAFSRIGGVLGAAVPYLLFKAADVVDSALYEHVVQHQLVLAGSGLALILVPVCIKGMMSSFSADDLMRYDFVVEQPQAKNATAAQGEGFGGIAQLASYPYVLGIFGLTYFYAFFNTVLSNIRIGVAQSSASSLSGVSAYLFQTALLVNVISFFLSALGTQYVMNHFGGRTGLLMVPAISGFCLVYYLLFPSPHAFIFSFVSLKVVYYALSAPMREQLYIPTSKTIKFKAKSWVDTLSNKIAKGSGSWFTIMVNMVGSAHAQIIQSTFFMATIGLWFVVSYLVGSRFERAVANNEVIGAEK